MMSDNMVNNWVYGNNGNCACTSNLSLNEHDYGLNAYETLALTPLIHQSKWALTKFKSIFFNEIIVIFIRLLLSMIS